VYLQVDADVSDKYAPEDGDSMFLRNPQHRPKLVLRFEALTAIIIIIVEVLGFGAVCICR
jgi:hypothetical protein